MPTPPHQALKLTAPHGKAGLGRRVAPPVAYALAALLLGTAAADEVRRPDAADDMPTDDPRLVVGAPRGPRLSGPALETRTVEVSALLRCPVCQGLSVADSPASMATNMKARVRELLAEGYDEEQVLVYFERSYGEFVRLKPPLRGVNWTLWLAPLVGLGAGAAAVYWRLRARGTPAPPAAAEDLPGRGTLPGDPVLAECVRRVREAAYGWPRGIPPEPGANGPAPADRPS